MLVLIFCISFGVVDSSSMSPSYEKDDIVLICKKCSIERNDCVFIWRNDTLNMKRVIGVGGDTIEMKGCILYVNNTQITKDYTEYNHQVKYSKLVIHKDWKIVVPQNKVFILGDNRDFSEDSRIYGCIPITSIYGRTLRN